MRDDRPVRYIERDDDGNETVVYRASGYGGICERALIAIASGMKGEDMPAWFREVLDEGAIVEGDIAAMVDETTGVHTYNDQAEVELEIGEIDGRRVIIRGHIDGEVHYDNDELVGREFKKFRPSTWPTFQRQGIEINKNYAWQASVYWHARGWDALEFVGGRIIGYRDADGVLHDEPADDRQPVIGEIEVKHLEAPPIPMKDIRRRIVRLERLIAEGGAVLDTACSKDNYPCPFFKLHDEDASDTTFALPTDKRTIEVVTTLVNVETRRKALAAELRSLDDAKKKVAVELREIVGAQGEAADAAKTLTLDAGNGVTHTLSRKRYHQAAKTIGAYDVDAISVKAPPKSASRIKPRPEKAHGVKKGA